MMSGTTRLGLIGLAAAVLAAGCAQEPPGGDAVSGALAAAPGGAGGHSGVLEGVVRDASGQPLAGAFVKLESTDGRLTFMFVSQDEGRYAAGMLPAGRFVVQAIGGDFQSAWSEPVEIAGQHPAQMDLALTVARAPDLPAAWPRRAPEHLVSVDRLPAGQGKDILMTRCVGCHTPVNLLSRRYASEAWPSIIEEMREAMRSVNLPDLAEDEVSAVIEYATAHLPPLPAPDPNSRLPRTPLQGEAMRYRVVQYNLANEGAEAHDVAVDPWGVGWANQRTGGKISRFDPVSYEYSEIGPPLYTAARARPGNLQISRDGIMWLPDPFETRWLSYDIAAQEWTDWPFPTDQIRGQVQGNSMAVHDDGTIWSSGPGAARRLDPASGEWSAWDTPTWTRTQKNPGGYGLTVAGDGRVWMAENLVDKMARFDGKTGEVVEFDIPVEGTAYPRRMDHDAGGDVWVGLWGVGKLLKIDQHTAEMTVIDPPIPYNGAYSIDFDETNDLLWVALQTVDIIARYNPRTGEWLMLPLPQSETDARRIEVDQSNPNRVWWSSTANFARMGFVELLQSGS